MNDNLNGILLEINVNLFSFSLTVPQDTGIVTTATLCYLFSNHASAYFLSLYTFYYFIFITDMFLCIHDCCFHHKSHGRCYCPLEMISVGDFVVLAKATGESVQDMTLSLFFPYCELWFCRREIVVSAEPQNRLHVFVWVQFSFVFISDQAMTFACQINPMV